MPSPTYQVPSVTTKDGTLSLACMTPDRTPSPTPMPMATTQAQAPMSVSCRVLADSRIHAIPAAPMAPSTDRSIDPIWITSVAPTTMISGTEA